MNLSELKDKASFHELLLIDAAIKAYQEMMTDAGRAIVVHSAKKIAKDYSDIMTSHLEPFLVTLDYGASRNLRNAFQRATDKFNENYKI